VQLAAVQGESQRYVGFGHAPMHLHICTLAFLQISRMCNFQVDNFCPKAVTSFAATQPRTHIAYIYVAAAMVYIV